MGRSSGDVTAQADALGCGARPDRVAKVLGKIADDLDAAQARVDALLVARRAAWEAGVAADPPMTQVALAAASRVKQPIVNRTLKSPTRRAG